MRRNPTPELIEIQPPVERAILVGAPLADEPESLVDEHLEELERLADTAEPWFNGSTRLTPLCT